MPENRDDRVLRALRKALEIVDEEDAQAELEELKNKKVTLADIRAAMEEATPEERKEYLDWLDAQYGDEEEKPKAEEPEPEPEPEPKPGPEPESKPEAKKTRPGRKSGQLYHWYWDDERQQAVPLDIPRVYNGPDEPDEVEYEQAS